MIEEIKNLVEQYVLWLKDKTTLKQVGDNWGADHNTPP